MNKLQIINRNRKLYALQFPNEDVKSSHCEIKLHCQNTLFQGAIKCVSTFVFYDKILLNKRNPVETI